MPSPSVAAHYALNGKAHRPGLWKCKDCREQFSVTVGTVFERSKIKLNVWLQAVYLLGSSKKGMSSHQLHRTLGVTYKTAWFMTHRIREAMKDTDTSLLGGPGSSGIVEADEVYLGKAKGQGKGAHYNSKQKVVALVERRGNVRAFHVPTVNVKTVKAILHGQIAASARLMTDSAGLGMSAQARPTLNDGQRASGTVTPEEALTLRSSPGTPVYRFNRLRFADDAPMSVEYATIVAACLPSLDAVETSLYLALERAGNRPVRALQRLRAVLLTREQAELLRAKPGDAGLLVERLGFLQNGRAVEFSQSYYRGDTYDFVAELSTSR